MRKYKLVVEAELELSDYLDTSDLTKFIKSNLIENGNDYRFTLELWSGDSGDTIEYAEINKLTVTEVTN